MKPRRLESETIFSISSPVFESAISRGVFSKPLVMSRWPRASRTSSIRTAAGPPEARTKASQAVLPRPSSLALEPITERFVAALEAALFSLQLARHDQVFQAAHAADRRRAAFSASFV